MARTTSITKELVYSTLDSMKARGINITAASLRTELGGGKYETYKDFMNEWKKEQADGGIKATTLNQSITVPEGALTAATQAAALIWKLATEHQNEAIQAIRIESEKIELAALQERDEAKEIVSTLENELESKDEIIERCRAEKEKLIQANNTLELQIQKMQLIMDNEIKKSESQAEKNAQLKADSEKAQGEINRLLVIAAQLDAAQSEIKELKAEAKETQSELIKLSVTAAQLESAQEEIRTLKADAANAQDKLIKLSVTEAQLESAQEEIKALKADAATIQAEKIATQIKLTDAEIRLKDADTEIETLKSAKPKTTAKKVAATE